MAGWDKFLQSSALPKFILGYNLAGEKIFRDRYSWNKH